jgi:cobyrinic acid a,c-diamide synthase
LPRGFIPRGLIIAAASSGSGKTTLTLGLLHLLTRQGIVARGCKIGPDYIDPAFHAAASGADCFNLDSWAMRPASLAALIDSSTPADLLVVEGVMGLFDGAAMPVGMAGDALPIGSTAQLAAMTGWPVILVLNVKGQGATAAAVARGLRDHHPDVHIAGVICNNVGGARHVEILRQAFDQLGLPVFGFVPQIAHLALPDRHLGLVQAAEHVDLPRFLQMAADHLATHVEIDRLIAAAQPIAMPVSEVAAQPQAALLPPLGQHIAIARDIAFAFAYSGQLLAWRKAGGELSFFSPLADEAADKAADAIFLPGGYPELHAGKLASNTRFLDGLRSAAARGVTIYGECGGYMTLGQSITDADGQHHAMLGLLPLETSFAQRKLHLGYREVRLLADHALGRAGGLLRGHEFHYATILREDEGGKLFDVTDAQGRDLGAAGHRHGSVSGSFLHLIDCR